MPKTSVHNERQWGGGIASEGAMGAKNLKFKKKKNNHIVKEKKKGFHCREHVARKKSMACLGSNGHY